MIHFASSSWLWAAAFLLPLAGLLLLRSHLARQRLFRTFANARGIFAPDASFCRIRQRTKEILILAALAILLLALARPQWGAQWRETRTRGIDVLFALDISRSMLATDVAPNRLERAKLAIRDTLPNLAGNRLGLIPFSGSAFLQTPLTLDFSAFNQALNLMQPGLLARGGTNLTAAIEEAQAAFGDGDNFKVLILVTDGENLEDGTMAAVESATEANIRVFTVGVGSSEGSRIPAPDRRGRPDFLRDERGEIVVSRLDRSTLEQIARIGGGFYTDLGSTGEGLRRVVEAGVGTIPPQELESRLEQIPIERFQIFVSIALALLAMEFILGNRRRLRTIPSSGAGAALCTTLTLLLLAPPAEANPENAVHEQLRNGDFSGAAEGFGTLMEERGRSPRLLYNQGVAAYRAGENDEAARLFTQALETPDLDLQADAFYNLANANFRLGEARVEGNPQAALSHWEEALNAYENTLELRPDDTNAAYNREVVQALLEQLQQQMQQQQDGQQPQPEQNENEDQGGESGGDDSRRQQESPTDSEEPENGRDEDGDSIPESDARGSESDESGPDDESDLMSRLEAEQLLDALRQRERLLPLIQGEETEPTDRTTPHRDW